MAAPGMRPHGSLALRGLGNARQARRCESGQSGDSVFLIMMEHRALAFSRAWSKALMLSASRGYPRLPYGGRTSGTRVGTTCPTQPAGQPSARAPREHTVAN